MAYIRTTHAMRRFIETNMMKYLHVSVRIIKGERYTFTFNEGRNKAKRAGMPIKLQIKNWRRV